MDSYLTGLLIVFSSVLLSVLGLLFVRKFADYQSLKSSHEVGGYMLSIVGTVYAVLLGLVVVDAMTRFQEGLAITESEANSLADIFILAERMPKDRSKVVQELCMKYSDLVINKEWPLMDKREICMDARRTAIALVREVQDWEPVTESQKAIYPIAISEACQLWDARRQRTNMSEHSVPPLEWFCLVMGGFVTVAFTYLFGLEKLKLQILMTSMVSMLIALNLFLVLMFGYPFSGELKVPPTPFEVDRKIFNNELGVLSGPQDIQAE